MIFMVVALAGLTGVITSSMVSSQTSFDAARAKEAARREMESIAASDFSEAFALYDDDPTNDPGGAGTAPGKYFAVSGLNLVAGDPDGFVGEVLFPTAIGAGGNVELREDVSFPALGMPRDLNGDGVVDSLDHSGDYRLLPVMVRLVWRSKAGTAKTTLQTQLADY